MSALQQYGTGRRKSAVARVFLRPGSGRFLVNDREVDAYFNNPILRAVVRHPLVVAELSERLDAFTSVSGGGHSGQAGAIRHGVARALLEYNAELRKKLREAGFLTRDPRVKERYKAGLKKARKAPQFSKR